MPCIYLPLDKKKKKKKKKERENVLVDIVFINKKITVKHNIDRWLCKEKLYKKK